MPRIVPFRNPIRNRNGNRNVGMRPMRPMPLRGFGVTEGEEIFGGGAVGITGTGGVQGAAKGAATGASIGSVFPGFGTAIGAAVGAIIGGLIHFGTSAQRLVTAKAIIGEIQQMPPNYQGRTLTVPVLTELYGALVSTGNFFGYVQPPPAMSPSDIQHEFDGFMAMLKAVIAQTNATPIGSPVNFSYNGWNGVNFTYSFINPGSLNTALYTQQVTIPCLTNWITHNGAVDVANGMKDMNNPLNQAVLQLITDYQVGQNPPPASQGPKAAPTTLVQQQPAAALPIVNQPKATATVQPVPVAVPMPPPVQQQIPVQQIPVQNPESNYPAPTPVNVSVAAPAASGGMSTTTMLIIGAIVVGVILMTRK